MWHSFFVKEAFSLGSNQAFELCKSDIELIEVFGWGVSGDFSKRMDVVRLVGIQIQIVLFEGKRSMNPVLPPER
jgi:hypothetical protein